MSSDLGVSAVNASHKLSESAHAQSMIQHQGFRLQRFEVFNWGTFNKKIWVMDQQGQNALLTGDNGSGKSTLVDALLTLLVPNKKRNYNLSSGAGKRERSELSYVKGAYSKGKNEFDQGQTNYLRKDDQCSVLLAFFRDDRLNEHISLAQVFWTDQQALKKIHIVSQQDLSIQEHLSGFTSIRQLKSTLNALSATHVYASFNEYEQHFRQFMGLHSSKGLDLFNQVTTIKEIGRLNDFVREHMLDATETHDLLAQLYVNYNNLSLSHQAILSAKKQLDELAPLDKLIATHQKHSSELSTLEQQQTQLPVIVKQKKRGLLTSWVESLQQDLQVQQETLDRVNEQYQSVQVQYNQLNQLFNQGEKGQILENLELLIARETDKKTEKLRRYEEYIELAAQLDLFEPDTREIFQENATLAQEKMHTLEAELIKDRESEYTLKKCIDGIQEEIEELAAEAQSLKNRRSQIPHQYADIRDAIAQALGIKSTELPFVAELVCVNPTHREWQGAIQSLLWPFALRVLVPCDVFDAFNRYVIKHPLGIQLAYHKLEIDPDAKHRVQQLEASLEAGTLYEKLEFKPRNSDYTNWVRLMLMQQYVYHCVTDVKTLKKLDYAMTPEGLIKRGQSLHEKDDRDQRHRLSILGWDNSEKVTDVLHALKQKQTQLREAQTQLKEQSQRSQEREQVRLFAIQFSQISSYATIHWQPHADEIETIQQQRALLLNKNSQSKQLERELKSLSDSLKQAQDQRDRELVQQAVLDNQLHHAQSSLSRLMSSMDQGSSDLDDAFVSVMLKKKKCDWSALGLEEVDLVGSQLQDDLTQKHRVLTHKRNANATHLVKKMAAFKAMFPEISSHLEAALEYADEFTALKEKIAQEALPEHEQRFKRLLNKSVVNDMLAFKSTLEMAYEQIEDAIVQLNASLEHIHYTDSTYVQLKVSRSQDTDIREFHAMLNHAMSLQKGKKSALDFEESFHRIKVILDQLKLQERWRNKVTDPRNWADFYVIERYRHEQTDKNYYSDSSGLSGGQKAKLAFTILASAVAHQYGLNRSQQQRSFRLVVIDEAFSKSDEINARYAMELFNNLQLQLMVVTPRDKIYVVEPYVNNIFLVQNNNTQSDSQLFCLPVSITAGHERDHERDHEKSPEKDNQESLKESLNDMALESVLHE